MKMKRVKSELFRIVIKNRQRTCKFLLFLALCYILAITIIQLPFDLKLPFSSDSLTPLLLHKSEPQLDQEQIPLEPTALINQSHNDQYRFLSRLNFDDKNGLLTDMDKAVYEAFQVGHKFWEEIKEFCPHSMLLSGFEFSDKGKNLMVIPCGMALGSQITLVAKPRKGHFEKEPRRVGQFTMVSQFVLELLGLKSVDGVEPPKILYFNPRLKGDWSGKPVIEQNTCYRMKWGSGLRCDGWASRADEETVDGQVKCENWKRDDNNHSERPKTSWLSNLFEGRTKKVTVDWPYPFEEEKLFVLTISAGLEGYHVNVDGRHVTSFPYRTGFALEDATGLSLNGDIDVHSIFATSLRTSHPSFAPQGHLDMSTSSEAPSVLPGPVEMFIGILSAGNHFAERMAVRKSWMQHEFVQSSKVVARFFVALTGTKEVNFDIRKEAEFYGDIVIVPYMDKYDLVVLKTLAICEFGVHRTAAKYIMKCDDDTFVRLDAVIQEANNVAANKSLYVGNINYNHKPLRKGKWSVTYEEWPEEDYPPYADGPGYIISSDIAQFIVSEFENHKLRLFKMEDVSMGMWVEKFNSSKPVEYIHSLKFCQFGCITGYYTAHYQSPTQMMCLWDKLLNSTGRPQCCNIR
ncbi:hypothetical protein ACET3Z_022544 [Daucus carota]